MWWRPGVNHQRPFLQHSLGHLGTSNPDMRAFSIEDAFPQQARVMQTRIGPKGRRAVFSKAEEDDYWVHQEGLSFLSCERTPLPGHNAGEWMGNSAPSGVNTT